MVSKNNKKANIQKLQLSNDDEEIIRIKNSIILAEDAKNEDSLPLMAPNPYTCSFCNLCMDYMDIIFKPSKQQVKKSVILYFLNKKLEMLLQSHCFHNTFIYSLIYLI